MSLASTVSRSLRCVVIPIVLSCCGPLSARTSLVAPSAPSLVTESLGYFKNMIRSIVCYRGKVWFGTYGMGLFRLHRSGKLERFSAKGGSLLDDRVNTLTVYGRELWIGTCGGINRFDGRRWRSVRSGRRSVAGDIYHCARRGPDGGIWIGTTGKGLSRFHRGRWKTFTTRDGLNSDWINDVAFVDGRVWVATSNGVCRSETGRMHWENVTPGDFPLNKNAVWFAFVPKRKELWVATSSGLWCFQDGTWYHPPSSNLASPAVYCLETDDHGTLWIGTDKGVTSFDLDDGWRFYGRRQGLEEPYTKVLYWDGGTKILWAGSYGGTLSRFAAGSWHSVVRRGRTVSRAGTEVSSER